MEQSINPSALLGSWLHSHEEDTPTTTVYRRANHDFPPSRGRKGLDLHPDGTLTERQIGPTDRAVKSAGQWRLNDQACLELFTGPGAEPAHRLQIESVGADRLVLKKDTSACAPSGKKS
jgi:hypothetical protein